MRLRVINILVTGFVSLALAPAVDAQIVFTDITDQAGVGLTDLLTESVAWGNIHNDGDLDLLVTTSDGSYLPEVSGGAGRGSPNSLPLEFGLGSSTESKGISIHWPSGKVQILRRIALDQYLDVTEPTARTRRNGGRRLAQ